MSKPFDIQISHVETYASGGELVLYCTHCRAQLLRSRRPVTLAEQVLAARHPDCPVERSTLVDALGDLYLGEESPSDTTWGVCDRTESAREADADAPTGGRPVGPDRVWA